MISVLEQVPNGNKNMQKLPQVIRSKSEISYSYMTIKMTQARINKGLIAIPKSLTKWFPYNIEEVRVYLDDSPIMQMKKYSPFNSTTRECRIYGMREWFVKNKIKSGDEVVIRVVDKDNFIYRILPEASFIVKTKQIQNKFDNAEDELDALKNLNEIANWLRADGDTVNLGEFNRLIKETDIQKRKKIIRRETFIKESVPYNVKILLGRIYSGHCQVCNFWFLKKDKNPYHEIHHVESEYSDHPKNLLLVCGNCHNQFHYADLRKLYRYGWISKVIFNDREFNINQIVFKQELMEATKEVYIDAE